MSMFKKRNPIIIGHPYPTASGYYRCFDGEKWIKVFEITDNYRRKMIAKFEAVKTEN